MTYLLKISIGPVQEFIASARRTGDLWYGSKLLSDISKAVATNIKDNKGKLIFPAETEINNDNSNISNIILAEIPDDKNPQQVYKDAKDFGKKEWERIYNEVLNSRNIKDNIYEKLFNKQVEDAIEFYAAAVPLENNDYQQAMKKLSKIFDGRKALRNFEQTPYNNNEYESYNTNLKSSLDGRRESVLKENHNIQGIKNGEQLCAIGLIKRIQGSFDQQYPSVARITVDSWIQRVKDTPEFQKFKECCENIKTVMKINDKRENLKVFPFDGSLLFEERYQQLKDEKYINDEDEKKLKDLLGNFKKPEFKKKYGTIYPYFAILKADGDNMGKIISRISAAKDHITFSENLAKFSESAKDIVEKHNGVCVYAGGDDVFAFLPLETSLPCARELRTAFKEKAENKLEQLIPNYKDLKEKASLSVGISVGHFMEPMEDLRNYAKEAENLAKNNNDEDETKRKDGLAILINPRSGGKFHVKDQWGKKLDEKIEKFTNLFLENKLPVKLPYDLRTLATSLKYRNINGETGTNRIRDKKIIKNEISVLLDRKKQNEHIKSKIKPRIDAIEKVKDLFDFAEEMLVAQWFATGKQVKEDK